MSYNTATPQDSTPRPIIQQQFLNNFQAINNVFTNNHVAMNLNQQGMHDVMTMSYQTDDPTTNSTQIGLYTKLTGSNSVPNLFFAPQSSGTPIQLTWDTLQIVQGTNSQNTFLPGPFVLYGGLVPAASATDGLTVTLAPSSTLIYVGLTVWYTGTNIVGFAATPTNITGSSFNLSFNPVYNNMGNIYYLAIGKP